MPAPYGLIDPSRWQPQGMPSGVGLMAGPPQPSFPAGGLLPQLTPAQPAANPMWSQVLRQVLQGLGSGVANAVTLPGDVYAGRVDPNSDRAITRSADLAGMLTMGAGAAPAAGDELGMGIRGYRGSAINPPMSFKDAVSALQAKYPSVKLDVSVSKDAPASLSRLVVPEADRNQGVGSAIMDELTKAADANGVTLALSPVADFGGNVGQLRDFYSRFGFVKNSGHAKDFTTRETYIRSPIVKDAGKPGAETY